MKVKELVNKACVYSAQGQKLCIVDHGPRFNSTFDGNTYPLPFAVDHRLAIKLLDASVNSFDVAKDGKTIRIHISLEE